MLCDPFPNLGRLGNLLGSDFFWNSFGAFARLGFPPASGRTVAEGFGSEGIDEILEELAVGWVSDIPFSDPPEHCLKILVNRKIGRFGFSFLGLNGQRALKHRDVVDA